MTVKGPTAAEQAIQVESRGLVLSGDLVVPEQATGIVLFAHGSGSSRHSSRNRFVAQWLQRSGLATLLIDLLTTDEEAEDRFTAHLRFDIELLAQRLLACVDWLDRDKSTAGLTVGLFGASTGGGAALLTAANRPQDIAAVVSRGGRPDLAGNALANVAAPTLLVVGGRDEVVLRLNQKALEQMTAARAKKLVIVPGATHLFEEHGALEEVARLSADWFVKYLTKT